MNADSHVLMQGSTAGRCAAWEALQHDTRAASGGLLLRAAPPQENNVLSGSAGAEKGLKLGYDELGANETRCAPELGRMKFRVPECGGPGARIPAVALCQVCGSRSRASDEGYAVLSNC